MKTTIVIFLFLAFAPFVLGGFMDVKNIVSGSANTGGNSANGSSDASGGSVVTGNASASAEVITQTSGGEGTTKVEASATANGKTEHVSKEVTGSDARVEVAASAAAGTSAATTTATSTVSVETSSPEVTNVSISRTPSSESKLEINIMGEIISALKNFFSYVVSIFKW